MNCKETLIKIYGKFGMPKHPRYDNTICILPTEELAIRIWIFPNGDAAFLLGSGRVIRLGNFFLPAKNMRNPFYER